MKTSHILATILLIQVISACFAFTWNQNNINALFENSDDIFDQVSQGLEPEELPCLDQFKVFVNQLKLRQEWAISFIDSWGKVPAGLLSGNSYDFGHYDQCVRLAYQIGEGVYEGQHCQLPLRNVGSENNPIFTLGVCISATCESRTVYAIMSRFYANVELVLSQQDSYHCSTDTVEDYGALQWTVIGLLIALGVGILFSTFYDLVKRHTLKTPSNIWNSFSLYRNANALFAQPKNPNSMTCLNGIRVLSMSWIVLYHAYQEYDSSYVIYNQNDISAFRTSGDKTFITNADLATDTFFVVSGLLLSYSFMKARDKGRYFNLLQYYLHRYLRLIPVFATVMLLVLAFGKYSGNGPRWDTWSEAPMHENCRQYWWSAILMIQNYVNPTKMCLPHTWYISIDWQFYLLAPLILYPLKKLGYRFIPVFIVLSTASIGFILGYSLANRYHFNAVDTNYYRFIYYASHAKVTQWLIGIYLGYILFKNRNKTYKLHWVIDTLLWILALGILVTIIFIPHPAYNNRTEDIVPFAFYVSLSRVIWAFVIAFLIWNCLNGLAKPVNWLLSFPFYEPLSKLSYAVFIVHYPLKMQISAFQRTAEYWTVYMWFLFFLSLLTLSILVSVPLVVCMEYPIRHLESAFDEAIRNADGLNRDGSTRRSLFRMPRIRMEKKTAF